MTCVQLLNMMKFKEIGNKEGFYIMNKLKLITTLLAFFLITSQTFAQNCAETAASMCPAVPEVNGPVSSTLSRVTRNECYHCGYS